MVAEVRRGERDGVHVGQDAGGEEDGGVHAWERVVGRVAGRVAGRASHGAGGDGAIPRLALGDGVVRREDEAASREAAPRKVKDLKRTMGDARSGIDATSQRMADPPCPALDVVGLHAGRRKYAAAIAVAAPPTAILRRFFWLRTPLGGWKNMKMAHP